MGARLNSKGNVSCDRGCLYTGSLLGSGSGGEDGGLLDSFVGYYTSGPMGTSKHENTNIHL